MSDLHPQSTLVLWLKGNAIATLLLSVSIIGAIYAGGRYVATYENQINRNQADVLSEGITIAKHQADIESLDRRINELRAKMLDLHNQSEAADRELKAKLEIMQAVQSKVDELSKFNTDRIGPVPIGPRR